MAPVICTRTIEARLSYGITMESTHVATLTLTGIYKEAKIIQISPKKKIAPLTSLGVLCDDGCTITLNKKTMIVH